MLSQAVHYWCWVFCFFCKGLFLFCPMSRNHGMQHDLSEGTPWAGIHMISSCASSGRMCEDVAHKGLMRSTNSPLTLDEFWWAMKKNENDLKWTWSWTCEVGHDNEMPTSKWSQHRWSWTYIMLSGCQAVLLWWVSSNLHLGNPWNQDGVLWTYCLWTVVEVQYMMWFQRWLQSNWKILTLALYDSGRTAPRRVMRWQYMGHQLDSPKCPQCIATMLVASLDRSIFLYIIF